MRAQALLADLQDQGVTVTAEGGRLILDGSADVLTDALVEELRAAKGELLAALHAAPGEVIWDADDWRAFFDERAAVAEYDGGMGRSEAEARALECCIVEWLDRHPEPSNPGRCAWCGREEITGSTVVPYGTQHHTWLHPQCWTPWYQKRRRQAEEALEALEIKAPADLLDDFGKTGEP